MDYSFLGRSGLSVSRLAFGTATFGGPDAVDAGVGKIGQIDVPEAKRIIDICRDAGVNYFDTSNIYSAGDSERVLGEALGADRQHVIIGSKATIRTGPGQHDLGSSRQHLVRACEDSLRRLNTDWIDLYQLHYPDYLTPIEETLRALDDLVRAGKIRYIGCSNFSGWQVARATAVSDALGLHRIVSHQISYSLADRDAENELVPVAIDQGVGLMVWGPLAGGFLSGKYRRGQPLPKGARLEALPQYPSIDDWDKGYDILDVIDKIAQERGRPVSEVAVNWILSKPWIGSVLLGARTEEQLKANLKASEWTLTEEEAAALDAVSAPKVPYPNWIQRDFNPERTPPLPAFRK